MNDNQDQWQRDTAQFNRLLFKSILFSTIAALLIGLGFDIAKAEEAPSSNAGLGYTDPYTIAQRAYFANG